MQYSDYKLHLINSGDFQLYKDIIYAKYCYDKLQYSVLDDYEMNFLNSHGHLLVDFSDYFTSFQIKCLKQLYDAHRQKVFRLKKKISKFFKCRYVYFITLTWSDDYLYSLSDYTRRKYVREYLSSLPFVDYHANIDFGSKTQREHYHCVLASDLSIDYFNSWQYGFMLIEPVTNSNLDFGRLSKYINKVSLHAVKESTGLNRAICPRYA